MTVPIPKARWRTQAVLLKTRSSCSLAQTQGSQSCFKRMPRVLKLKHEPAVSLQTELIIPFPNGTIGIRKCWKYLKIKTELNCRHPNIAIELARTKSHITRRILITKLHLGSLNVFVRMHCEILMSCSVVAQTSLVRTKERCLPEKIIYQYASGQQELVRPPLSIRCPWSRI